MKIFVFISILIFSLNVFAQQSEEIIINELPPIETDDKKDDGGSTGSTENEAPVAASDDDPEESEESEKEDDNAIGSFITQVKRAVSPKTAPERPVVTQEMWDKVNEAPRYRCSERTSVPYKYVDIRDLVKMQKCDGKEIKLFADLLNTLTTSFSPRHFDNAIFRRDFYPLAKSYKSPGAWRTLFNKYDVVYGVEIEKIQRVREPSCGNRQWADQVDIIAFYNSTKLKKMKYSRSGYVFKRLRLYMQNGKLCSSVKNLPTADAMPIRVEDTWCEFRTGLMEFRHVLTCYKHGIRKVYPTGVGALDTGVLEVNDLRKYAASGRQDALRDIADPAHVNITSMTYTFPEGSYLPRNFIMSGRVEPDYYEGLPFIRYFHDTSGYTELGAHIQQNHVMGQMDFGFVRGIDSHGCNRLRPKDLAELQALVRHGCHQHRNSKGKRVGCAMPYTSYYRLSTGPREALRRVSEKANHPMPIRKWKIKRLLNVGTWHMPVRLRTMGDRLSYTVSKKIDDPAKFDRIVGCLRDPGDGECTSEQLKTVLLELEPEANPELRGDISATELADEIEKAQTSRSEWTSFRDRIMSRKLSRERQREYERPDNNDWFCFFCDNRRRPERRDSVRRRWTPDRGTIEVTPEERRRERLRRQREQRRRERERQRRRRREQQWNPFDNMGG